MKLPLEWLRDYIEEVPPIDELERRLTMAGLEVEEVSAPDPRMVENLRVARIDEMRPHPNADRLSLCTVDDGEGPRPIVCGARNMKAGDHVVLALPGAVLPGGFKIKKSKIRGEASAGMLCSASEIGLGDDHSGIMILGDGVEAGADAAPLLGLADAVLEIGITPNRGDCLSIRGLAREVAATCGVALTERFSRRFEAPGGDSQFAVRIDAADDCALYHGIELSGVRAGPSPKWVVGRLAAAGVRAINNIVDITNLILIELGQPLHAFDADLLSGSTVAVATVTEALKIETLDDETRELLPGDLAIWDAEGPVAIAGVMGGARTAVHAETTRIVLESAFFRPACVRSTSRRLGLISESSYRFERGVDPAGVERAMLAAAELIVELAGGSIEGGPVRAGEGVTPTPPIRLRTERVGSLLGIEIETDEAAALLATLGAEVERDGSDVVVTVPSHRSDITREVDLIEEVARIRGYDSIPEQAPTRAMQATTTPAVRSLHARLRASLCSHGLTEAVGLAFCAGEQNSRFPGLHGVDATAIQIRNPLSVETTELRRSVLPCLVAAHALNARNGVEATDLFTIGRTFSRAGRGQSGADDGLSDELEVVGGLLWGPRRSRKPGADGNATVWDAKSCVERIAAEVGAASALRFEPVTDRAEYHPRAAARVLVDGKPVGALGMIHPDLAEVAEIPQEIGIFEVDTQKLLEYAPPRSGVRQLPRYPASSRDVSLLVPDSLLAGAVIDAVEALNEGLIERVGVFDEYKGAGVGEGYRALAFQIVYRSSSATLTDDEVTDLHQRVITHLVDTLPVTLRV